MQGQRQDSDRIRVAHEVLGVDSVKVPVLDCGCNFYVSGVVPETEYSMIPAVEGN